MMNGTTNHEHILAQARRDREAEELQEYFKAISNVPRPKVTNWELFWLLNGFFDYLAGLTNRAQKELSEMLEHGACPPEDHEIQKHPVECQFCDRAEVEIWPALKAKGWLINFHGEYCPVHNYEVYGQPRCAQSVQVQAAIA